MSTLFTIETDQVRLTWSQRRKKTPPVEPEEPEQPFGLVVHSPRQGVVPDVRLHDDEITHLFEQTDYTLFVQNKTGASVRVHHRDPILLQGLHHSDDRGVVHGTINFGTQVGKSRFRVHLDEAPHLVVDVEVFPSKLDYRHDYEALRDDVQAIAMDLVLAYLRATYEPGRIFPSDQHGALTWVVLLRHVMDDLEQALRYMAGQPHWGTQQATAWQRSDRVQGPDSVLRRAVLRGKGGGSWQEIQGVSVRERLPARHRRYTLDTPEHRWLAWQLARIDSRLAHLREEEARHPPGIRRKRVAEELETLHHRVARLRQLDVVREAQGLPPEEPSLRLLTAPGYREAYRSCLLLQQGIRVEGDPLALNLKELHLLYEYWCFLTLVRLVAEIAGNTMPVQSLLAIEQHGVRLRLCKGHTQTITFPLASKRQVDLTYNPRFGGKSYLVPQQPDMLLTLHHTNGTLTRYVLDAKYRLDASPGYQRRYGLPGPPTEALNTLHRYRDAIRGQPSQEERVVVQAVALFPYREDEPGRFQASRLCRMLGTIGVGAIPLLPDATAHLQTWLRQVLIGALDA